MQETNYMTDDEYNSIKNAVSESLKNLKGGKNNKKTLKNIINAEAAEIKKRHADGVPIADMARDMAARIGGVGQKVKERTLIAYICAIVSPPPPKPDDSGTPDQSSATQTATVQPPPGATNPTQTVTVQPPSKVTNPTQTAASASTESEANAVRADSF